jgi:hypothetical protein
MKRVLVAVMFLGIAAYAADIPYKKVGAWSVIAITNNDGTLNRCTIHQNGPQGFMRIAVTPDMKKWSFSIPGNGPQMKLRPGKVWGEPNWEQPHDSILGRLFIHDGSARAWTDLNGGDLSELKTATGISVKLNDRADPAGNTPNITYRWPAKDIRLALAALPGCLKAN